MIDHLASAIREQIHSIRPDLAYALRALARRPGFAAVVMGSIALGVGANAAIFSVVNGILLRPLPHPDADRVVVFGHLPPQWLVSEPQYATYRSELRAFKSLAAFSNSEANLSTSEDPEHIAIASVTPNFFATLGTAPLLGRTFVEGEDHVRPSPLVVLSYRLWQQRYASDSAIVGRSILLNGVKRTVIGVMPERFEYPSAETQLWLPICSQRTCASLASLTPDTLDGWANHYLHLVGRLGRGVPLAQARMQAATIAARIMREHPDNFNPREPLTPKIDAMSDTLVGSTKPYLVALIGAVAVILLIMCANVANLLLAAGESRRREMALRTALGASRRRQVVQLLTESLALALVGGFLGVSIGWAGNRVLVALAPASLPRVQDIVMDWTVVVYCLTVTVMAGLIFGVAPAMRASAQSPAESLHADSKGATARGMSRRARHGLMVAEIALAMTLLTAAGMLIRSLVHLSNMDIGFEPQGTLTATVSLNPNEYDQARTAEFYSELLPRVRAIPGVRTAGAARWLPVVDAGGLWSQSFAKQFIGGDAPADLTSLALGKRFRLGGRDSGADWSSVLTMVFRDGVRLALIGLGIGLVASTLLARVMRSLLVKVSVIDVPTLAAVVAVLSAIAVLASALPARRATAVNPTDALRGS